MNARIDFGNGRIVELSQKSTEKLKKEFLKLPVFEKVLGDIVRISSTYEKKSKTVFPIRLSILEGIKEGKKMGKFGDPYPSSKNIAGYTMCIEQVKELINILEEAIQFEGSR